jgi:hypothetical protein
MVSKIACEDGYRVKTEMLAVANYALADHWNDGKLQKLIASGKFDYVVVQQGPSSQEEGRRMLIDYGEKINEQCKKYNVRLAFYMVWPAMSYYDTFEGVIRNYSEVAKRFNAILCPVGEVWRTHFDSTANYSYYGPDMFHPSPEGSAVAARVIWQSLLGDILSR